MPEEKSTRVYRRVEDLTVPSGHHAQSTAELQQHWRELEELSPDDYARHVQGSELSPFYQEPTPQLWPIVAGMVAIVVIILLAA